MGEHIYLIELQNNKYYVGKTKNFERRMDQHQTGQGAIFTRRYGPQKTCTSLMQVNTGSAGEETKKTLEYMILHGINSVRGAEYCQIEDFTLDDCKRMSYAALHHLGRNQEEVENIFRSQIISSQMKDLKLNNSKINKQQENNFSQINNQEETDNNQINNLLLINLKEFRNNKANEENVDLYFIITNETINELINHKPTTLEQLIKIKGIGEKKLNKKLKSIKCFDKNFLQN